MRQSVEGVAVSEPRTHPRDRRARRPALLLVRRRRRVGCIPKVLVEHYPVTLGRAPNSKALSDRPGAFGMAKLLECLPKRHVNPVVLVSRPCGAFHWTCPLPTRRLRHRNCSKSPSRIPKRDRALLLIRIFCRLNFDPAFPWRGVPKRRQAGRTPNASRQPMRHPFAKRLECGELAPAFCFASGPPEVRKGKIDSESEFEGMNEQTSLMTEARKPFGYASGFVSQRDSATKPRVVPQSGNYPG